MLCAGGGGHPIENGIRRSGRNTPIGEGRDHRPIRRVEADNDVPVTRQVLRKRRVVGAQGSAVGVDDIQLQMVLFFAIAAEDDPFAVGREKGTAVVAPRRMRQLADVLAVGSMMYSSKLFSPLRLEQKTICLPSGE